MLSVFLAFWHLRDPVLAVPAGGSHWTAIWTQVSLLSAAVEGALDYHAAETVRLQAHYAGWIAAFVQAREIGVVRVVRLRLLGLAVVQVILLYFLFLHHWLQGLFLLLLLNCKGELAEPLLGVWSLLLYQLLQFLLGDYVPFLDYFKEGVHQVLWRSALLLLSAPLLTDL